MFKDLEEDKNEDSNEDESKFDPEAPNSKNLLQYFAMLKEH
jgi:hypothetical protein